MNELLVATFYKFTKLDELASLQKSIETRCIENNVRGIVLIANEGINATIAGSRDEVLGVLHFLLEDPRLDGLAWKESTVKKQPFRKLRVRLKKEIVTMGVEGIDPERLTGSYVKPEEWNALISDPNVILVDTRNDYEVEIGSFKNSINPNIVSFGELPQWLEDNIDVNEQPRVAMFCTGGIRCEKSTAYLKESNFENVFHLEGGILKYLEQIPEDQSLWEGQCFVFDERVSVGHGLEAGEYELCRACRTPIGEVEKAASSFREGVSCPRCYDKTTDEQKARFAERQKQIDLAKGRGTKHLVE
ncbi:MAG TPA: rhodanese-related sulfurtransferase [Phycisphaerales bacterium]|nr:rhodanese-related sulfurtransferase [Phycisphaerales bacterium]HIN83716.1 rhodanese-related sulfurtransferase [Phycisphaerales bacterium]HIO52147.1 rhodanese-related sulfurtransferase [Phycisphaerales bacterium]